MANFSLCHLPAGSIEAADFVAAARERGLFLRELGGMSRTPGPDAFRIAVKDRPTNARMLEILTDIL
jgi:histidinol-phosphate/aromatic aminotransferase/cobyric acid decarboxylase-like protein